jgi:hypothetical protein
MLYMTAGLADVGIKPDVEVESAIVKQFAVETSDFVTRLCLDMLGAKTNLKGSPFQQFMAENHVLQSWQGSANILKCFIAISGNEYLFCIFFANAEDKICRRVLTKIFCSVNKNIVQYCRLCFFVFFLNRFMHSVYCI